MKLPRRNVKRGRVEIIPMIDTILILLIFYMSFSTFRAQENAMSFRLPPSPSKGADGRQPPPVGYVVLHVIDRRNILVNGSARFDDESLQEVLRGVAAMQREPIRVILEADPETAYEHVIAALDACTQARVTNLGFRAWEPSSPGVPGAPGQPTVN